MKDLSSYVLCARFMSTVCHLLTLLLLTLTYKSNVEVGLSDSATSTDRSDEQDKSLVRFTDLIGLICIFHVHSDLPLCFHHSAAQILIYFGLFCMIWDLMGTVCGFSIFFTYVSYDHSCAVNGTNLLGCRCL